MKIIKYIYLILHYIAVLFIGLNLGILYHTGVTVDGVIDMSVLVIVWIITGIIYRDLRKRCKTIRMYTLQDEKPDDFPEEIWEQLTLFEQMLNAKNEEGEEDDKDK